MTSKTRDIRGKKKGEYSRVRTTAYLIVFLDGERHTEKDAISIVNSKQNDYTRLSRVISTDTSRPNDWLLSTYSPIHTSLVEDGILKEDGRIQRKPGNYATEAKAFRINVEMFYPIFKMMVDSFDIYSDQDWPLLEKALHSFVNSSFFNNQIMGMFNEYKDCIGEPGGLYHHMDDSGELEKVSDPWNSEKPIIHIIDKLQPLVHISPSVLGLCLGVLKEVREKNMDEKKFTKEVLIPKRKEIAEKLEAGTISKQEYWESFEKNEPTVRTRFDIELNTVLGALFHDWHNKRLLPHDERIFGISYSSSEPGRTTITVYLDFTRLKLLNKYMAQDKEGNPMIDDFLEESISTSVIFADKKYRDDNGLQLHRKIDNKRFKEQISSITYYLPGNALPAGFIPVDHFFKKWYWDNKRNGTLDPGFSIDTVLLPSGFNTSHRDWKKYLEVPNRQDYIDDLEHELGIPKGIVTSMLPDNNNRTNNRLKIEIK